MKKFAWDYRRSVMTSFNFIYLGSQYTSDSLEVMESRARSAAHATAVLLRAGIYVYSPITHCHSIAVQYDLPRDFTFWRDYNFAMLSKAMAMVVLRLPGSDYSKGLISEKKFCQHHKIPIYETWSDKISTDAEIHRLKEIVARLEEEDAPLIHTIG